MTNPEKVREQKRARYAANPEKMREQARARTYKTDVDALLDAQNGKCAICTTPVARGNVDHDHSCCAGYRSCGRCVRGVLCGGCNRGLGNFRDSKDTPTPVVLPLWRLIPFPRCGWWTRMKNPSQGSG